MNMQGQEASDVAQTPDDEDGRFLGRIGHGGGSGKGRAEGNGGTLRGAASARGCAARGSGGAAAM